MPAVAVESRAAAGFREDARLIRKGVMFVTAHVVGSDNGSEIRDPPAVGEPFARSNAAVAWLRRSFAAAATEDAAAVVMAIQADMFEFGFGMHRAPASPSG